MKRREQQCKLYIRLDSGYEQDQERACPAWIFTSIETHPARNCPRRRPYPGQQTANYSQLDNLLYLGLSTICRMNEDKCGDLKF
jgi:hypothetical protein